MERSDQAGDTFPGSDVRVNTMHCTLIQRQVMGHPILFNSLFAEERGKKEKKDPAAQ